MKKGIPSKVEGEIVARVKREMNLPRLAASVRAGLSRPPLPRFMLETAPAIFEPVLAHPISWEPDPQASRKAPRSRVR